MGKARLKIYTVFDSHDQKLLCAISVLISVTVFSQRYFLRFFPPMVAITNQSRDWGGRIKCLGNCICVDKGGCRRFFNGHQQSSIRNCVIVVY